MIDPAVMQNIAETYLKCVTAQDVEGVCALYADEAIVEDPIGTEAYVGIDAIRGFYETALKNNKFVCELSGPVRCAASSLAFPFLLTVPRVRTNNIIDVFDLNENGKVIAMKAYWGPANITPFAD